MGANYYLLKYLTGSYIDVNNITHPICIELGCLYCYDLEQPSYNETCLYEDGQWLIESIDEQDSTLAMVHHVYNDCNEIVGLYEEVYSMPRL